MKRSLLYLLIGMFSLMLMSGSPAPENKQEKPTLIYVFDPMCGWCYAFGPVINRIHENYKDKLNFEVVPGGMVLGERRMNIKKFEDFIQQAYPVIEESSDVTYGKAFLEDLHNEGTYVYDSEPPSVAFVILREMQPENAVAFAHEIQKTLYLEGKDVNKPESYRALLQKYQIDENVFTQKMKDSTYYKIARNDFQKSDQWHVEGYPTIFIRDEKGMHMVTYGYAKYEYVTKKINKHLGIK